jgi:hypothetical protein
MELERKAYAAPQLIEHGSVVRITLQGQGTPPPAAEHGLSTACNASGNTNPCGFLGNIRN